MRTDEIAASILEARDDVLRRFFASDLGEEFVRLDAAYRALTGEEPPTIGVIGPAKTGTKLAAAAGRRLQATSVRGMVKAILDEGPVAWDYDKLVPALEERGIEVRDADGIVKSSVRTAVWTLVNSGDARRDDDGTFFSTKYYSVLVPEGVGPDSLAQIDPDYEGE